MKYYAVTEDPNELFHYGRLGMKWGQHIFGEDKSPAFRNAARKLRATKAKAKAAIVKSSAQRDISRVQRQQNRMQKKVMRDQRRAAKIRSINAANKKKEQMRSNLVNAMATLDQEDSFRKQFNQDHKIEAKVNKYQNKIDRLSAKRDIIDQRNMIRNMKRSNKAEKKLNKYVQQARQGKLKYGKLTDEQVQKVQDRLNMENRTRQLGSAEKTWRQQRKDAIRRGVLEGLSKGTTAAMEEVARGLVQNKMRNRRVLDKKSSNEAEREKQRQRIKNQKTNKEISADLKQEAREAEIKAGKGFWERDMFYTTKGAAKSLKKIEAAKEDELHKKKLEQRAEERKLRSQERLEDNQAETYQKFLLDVGKTDEEARANYSHDRKYLSLDAAGQRDWIVQNEASKKEDANKKAYELYDAEQKRIRENEQITKENEKKLEEYDRQKALYDAQKQHDDDLKKEYNKKLKAFNEEHAAWEKKKMNGVDAKTLGPEPVFNEPTPKYLNPTLPSVPRLKDTNDKQTDFDYKTYLRLRDLGLDPYKKDNGGKNKKK